VENIKFFLSYRISDADDAETHFLAHYRHFHLYATIYTRSNCCYTPNRWAWSLPVKWQRRRSSHSISRGPHRFLSVWASHVFGPHGIFQLVQRMESRVQPIYSVSQKK